MNLENVAESFNDLLWHDSKLRGIRIQHNGDSDDIILDVELRESSTNKLIPVNIILEMGSFYNNRIERYCYSY